MWRLTKRKHPDHEHCLGKLHWSVILWVLSMTFKGFYGFCPRVMSSYQDWLSRSLLAWMCAGPSDELASRHARSDPALGGAMLALQVRREASASSDQAEQT